MTARLPASRSGPRGVFRSPRVGHRLRARKSFQSRRIAAAMSFAALRSHFAFRPRRSCQTRRIRGRLPRWTLATSLPLARSSVSSSRCVGSVAMSMGFASGERRRINQVPLMVWYGSRERTAPSIAR